MCLLYKKKHIHGNEIYSSCEASSSRGTHIVKSCGCDIEYMFDEKFVAITCP